MSGSKQLVNYSSMICVLPTWFVKLDICMVYIPLVKDLFLM